MGVPRKGFQFASQFITGKALLTLEYCWNCIFVLAFSKVGYEGLDGPPREVVVQRVEAGTLSVILFLRIGTAVFMTRTFLHQIFRVLVIEHLDEVGQLKQEGVLHPDLQLLECANQMCYLSDDDATLPSCPFRRGSPPRRPAPQRSPR